MENIPSIFVLSAGAAVIAVVGFIIVRRVTKPIDLEEHQSFLDAMLSIVGTLVSILLGLLVAASLDHYRSLEQSVDTEAANVAQVFRLSLGLPVEFRKKIRHECADYCFQVINDEWPAMAQGHASSKVFRTLALTIYDVVSFQPSTNGETNIHSALISAMQQISDARRQRLLVLTSEWSKHLMPMLMMCSAIVLVFSYLYVRKGAILHGLLICFVAIALGGNLGLVYVLSNPFSGDWKIRPKGFELNLQMLQEVNSSPELKKVLKTGNE